MKVCFVKSIYADKIEDIDIPEKNEINENYDYILFTNQEKIIEIIDTNWKIIILKLNFKTQIINSRYIKFMVHEYFKENNMFYDLIIYCDAIYHPVLDFDLNKIIFNDNKINLYQWNHPRNIDEEINQIIKCRKDSLIKMEILKNNLLKNFLEKSCFQNGFLIYNPNDNKLIKLFNEFWKLFKKDFTNRDQPIWAYILHKNNEYQYLFFHNKDPIETFFIKSGKKGFNNHKYIEKN